MKNISKQISLLAILLAPSITFAADQDLKSIARLVTDYLNIGISMIIGLAVVVFIWNVFIYFFTEKDKVEAGKYVLYSVIGFVVILSFWGIVAIFRNTLDLNNTQPSNVPASLNFNNSTQPLNSNTAGQTRTP